MPSPALPDPKLFSPEAVDAETAEFNRKLGLAIAATNLAVAVVIGVYLGLTLNAARRSEEAHLREKFGDAYDAYAENRVEPEARPFSWARAIRNREHHAVAGLITGFATLALKIVM